MAEKELGALGALLRAAVAMYLAMGLHPSSTARIRSLTTSEVSRIEAGISQRGLALKLCSVWDPPDHEVPITHIMKKCMLFGTLRNSQTRQ